MLLMNIEFFTHEGEVYIQSGNSDVRKLQVSDTELVSELVEYVETFYPNAHKALCDIYSGCSRNLPYFKYRIASRFVRCNLGALDNIPDFSSEGKCNLEFVACPLRGECQFENVICRPSFDHQLSTAEEPVMRLWFEGLGLDIIGQRLHLSPNTVRNHIRNAYYRLNIHSRSEFVKFAVQNGLFS